MKTDFCIYLQILNMNINNWAGVINHSLSLTNDDDDDNNDDDKEGCIYYVVGTYTTVWFLEVSKVIIFVFALNLVLMTVAMYQNICQAWRFGT